MMLRVSAWVAAAVAQAFVCKAEYIVDERLSHLLGIKVCPTCSVEAEAATAVE